MDRVAGPVVKRAAFSVPIGNSAAPNRAGTSRMCRMVFRSLCRAASGGSAGPTVRTVPASLVVITSLDGADGVARLSASRRNFYRDACQGWAFPGDSHPAGRRTCGTSKSDEFLPSASIPKQACRNRLKVGPGKPVD